jgi:hypothetical protein
MKLKIGSNQHEYKKRIISSDCAWSIVCVLLVSVLTYTGLQITKPTIVSPVYGEGPQGYNVQPKPLTVDEMVDKYATRYAKTTWQKNRTKALLHFLLLREQNYGGSNNCGDSGLACGPLQFHEATYQGYRKIMVARKLTNKIGSRLDMSDAIQTAAWAICDGRETAWGPVARQEIKL